MSFSYKSGLAVAKITGGSKDGKIIHVNTARPYEPEELKKTIADVSDYIRVMKADIEESEMKELCAAISMQRPDGLTRDLQRLYAGYMIAREQKELGPRVEILDGVLSMLPRDIPNQTDIIYLAAPQGSGKSRFTNNYMLEYKKMFPKNNIYFFTSKSGDDPEITAPIMRAIIDDSLITDPLNISDMPDSLFVFDDVDDDAMANKKHAMAIHTLILDVIKNGRKLGIRAIICRHVGNERQKTKALLIESTHLVLFPFSSGAYNMNMALMEKYLGYDKKTAARVLSMPTRWVVISRQEPQYIITENAIAMKRNL